MPQGDVSPEGDIPLDDGGNFPLSSLMTIEQFIEACDRYCEASGVSRTWLSKKLFADTNRLNDLDAGKSDVGVNRLARAVTDLAALGSTAEAA